MSYSLTPRARELLAFLRSRETCPTYREMAAALGYQGRAGLSNVTRLLMQLEERGYIARSYKKSRSIRLLDPTPAGIPILGPVPAPWSYPFGHRTVAQVWADEAREAA